MTTTAVAAGPNTCDDSPTDASMSVAWASRPIVSGLTRRKPAFAKAPLVADVNASVSPSSAIPSCAEPDNDADTERSLVKFRSNPAALSADTTPLDKDGVSVSASTAFSCRSSRNSDQSWMPAVTRKGSLATPAFSAVCRLPASAPSEVKALMSATLPRLSRPTSVVRASSTDACADPVKPSPSTCASVRSSTGTRAPKTASPNNPETTSLQASMAAVISLRTASPRVMSPVKVSTPSTTKAPLAPVPVRLTLVASPSRTRAASRSGSAKTNSTRSRPVPPSMAGSALLLATSALSLSTRNTSLPWPPVTRRL